VIQRIEKLELATLQTERRSYGNRFELQNSIQKVNRHPRKFRVFLQKTIINLPSRDDFDLRVFKQNLERSVIGASAALGNNDPFYQKA
jgi:hypothetical protein